jgi:hypothetical protein
MTIEELAQEVLDMLMLQRIYFKTRERLDLIASKQAEGALKKKCEEIVRGSS